MEDFRRPDRLTIAVGRTYINVRERADAATYNGYEHFGVAVEGNLAQHDVPGAIGAEGMVKVLDLAMKIGCPIIGINDSGGARIQDAATSLAW